MRRNHLKTRQIGWMTLAAVVGMATATDFASAQVSNTNPFGTSVIDTSGSATGVVSIATGSPNASNTHDVFRTAGFTQYTNFIAPNGKPIHIIGQANVSEAQLRRARSIMGFYLNSVGNTYGPAQKANVANTMANNNATLLYTNMAGGIEQVFNVPGFDNLNIAGQDLGGDESPLVGSPIWRDNSDRDASYEEIFHLVHGHGIQTGLPAFNNQINAALANARPNRNTSPTNIWTVTPQFYDELAAEGTFSLATEYMISAIDVYYGLWAHDANNPNGSFFGEYKPTTRANLGTIDPMGLAAVQAYLPSSLNYTEYVDASFNGTFSLAFDANTAYTHKSQYLRDVVLTGSNNSGLLGNDLDNLLGGNSGNNALDGGLGTDTALFSGAFSAYSITDNGSGAFTISGGLDGTDTLTNFEFAKFSDRIVALGAVIPEPTSGLLAAIGGILLAVRWRRNRQEM